MEDATMPDEPTGRTVPRTERTGNVESAAFPCRSLIAVYSLIARRGMPMVE